MKTEKLSIAISDSIGAVSAEVNEPSRMIAMMSLAHGAGAGMNHRFMTALSKELNDLNIGTTRFNFPYMEKGKGRPDAPAVAEKTVRVVLETIQERYPSIAVIAAGKSFGGRMTSQMAARLKPSFLRAIIFYGFPLHPAGAPATDRATHLSDVTVPMLFLQGTKDTLAERPLVQQTVSHLPNATLVFFEGADHSFKAGKKEFIPELAVATHDWLHKTLAGASGH